MRQLANFFDCAKESSLRCFLDLILTWIGGKARPTRKLADQFVATAMEVAMGLPDWLKSSVTKNQGMEPGPVAKPITKQITMAIETYLSQVTES